MLRCRSALTKGLQLEARSSDTPTKLVKITMFYLKCFVYCMFIRSAGECTKIHSLRSKINKNQPNAVPSQFFRLPDVGLLIGSRNTLIQTAKLHISKIPEIYCSQIHDERHEERSAVTVV